MLNIVFAGTPSFALPTLDLLINEFNLVCVLTSPAKKQGRKMLLKNSDVFSHIENLKHEGKLRDDFPVFATEKLEDDLIKQIEQLKPDLLVCFAYGKIFSPQFMSIFSKGGINIHPSLLPKWRGASPIPSAMYAGEFNTGISLQTIKPKMDSGDLLIQEKITIERGMTADSVLSVQVAEKSPLLLKEVLENLQEKLNNAIPQNEAEATYSHLLKKNDGIIDWKRKAIEIEWQINAFSSWPGTYTFCNGKKLNIIEAYALDEKIECETNPAGLVFGKNEGILVATGEGILCIKKLQWETKKVLYWKDFLNGAPSFIGSYLKSE